MIMRRCFFSIYVILILFSLLFAFSGYGQSDTIINRYRSYLLQIDTTDIAYVQKLHNSIRPDGTWSDINYQDTEPAAWNVSEHLKRLQAMATLFTKPNNALYQDVSLLRSIEKAIDHWTEKRYQSSNWWHNQIGVPRYMRDIIILLRHYLDDNRWQKALSVMAQLQVNDHYLAGNLIWCADLGLHYAALTDDLQLMQRCRDLIVKEVKIGRGEGIQPDYSFQQHGARLQMYQYGKAYIWESLRIAWQLRGTSLAFPDEKVQILTEVVLSGWQWMARGIYTVPGTMDRSSSRKGELRAADIRPLIPFIVAVSPERKRELMEMNAVMNQSRSLKGFRYYPFSDFAAYHRPEFSFFLKTISTRTLPTESINRENLKGKLLNSGDAYLIRTGEEYTDLMPVWDWNRLPGVTAFQGAHAIERKEFVGSVSDGVSGVSVMDYVIKDSIGRQKLSAKKLWVCYEDFVICLIAGIKDEQIPGRIYTAIDQCRWHGSIATDLNSIELSEGTHVLHGVSWVYHNGFAYILLESSDMEIQLKSVTGSWHDINRAESKTVITEKVFTPVIYHNSKENNATGYVLTRANSTAAVNKLVRRPHWSVIANDENVQAVHLKKNVLMAAFHNAGTVPYKKGKINVDKACLMLVKGGKIYISDPTHKGATVTITTHRHAKTIALPKDGKTIIIENLL